MDGNQPQSAILINNFPHSRPLHGPIDKIVRVSFTLFDSLRPGGSGSRGGAVGYLARLKGPLSTSAPLGISSRSHPRAARPEVTGTCSWLKFIALYFLFILSPPFMPLIKGVIFSSPHPLLPPLPNRAQGKRNPPLFPGQPLALSPGELRSMVTDAAGGRRGVGQARHFSRVRTNTDHR